MIKRELKLWEQQFKHRKQTNHPTNTEVVVKQQISRENQAQTKESLHLIIPLLCAPHNVKNVPRNKSILASFIGNLNNHPIRQRMERMFRDKSDIIIEQGNFKDPDNQQRFEYLLSNSTFALCPRGVGSGSYRLLESLQYGCVPVYISDVFSLPFPKDIDWKGCVIMIKPQDLPTLYTKLQKMNPKLLHAYKIKGKKAYEKYLTMEKTCENMLKYIPK